MTTKRWDLLDEILAKCARIANNAPDKYPDFLKEIGASMDYDFSTIEENIIELKSIIKIDLNAFDELASEIQRAKTYYYSGQYDKGEDILWLIYNDERIMNLK